MEPRGQHRLLARAAQKRAAAFFAVTALAIAQNPAAPAADKDRPSDAEQTDLMRAVNEGQNSTIDMVRVFEAFLKKYPETKYRPDIEANLTKASIQNKDDARVVLYGERVLGRVPDDILTLDRVSMSLVALGGKENAQKALKYARTLDGIITGLQPPEGADGPRIQEDRDRALSRALMTEAGAQAILDDKEESRRLAERAYDLYPSEETARTLADAWARLGRENDALDRLEDAFAVPDSRAAPADRLTDRLRLGEMWKKSHGGSEKGLGDELLAAYDRASSAVELRQKKLLALDPNGAAKSVGEFTITALDGKKLQMSSLEGKVLVLDFWATWCEPCRGQHPVYEEVMDRYKNRDDVAFLPLSVDEDHSVVQPFLDSMKWDERAYFDDGLQRVLGVSQIPTTIVLNKKGIVSSRMNGFAPDRFKQDLIDRIDAALDDSGQQ